MTLRISLPYVGPWDWSQFHQYHSHRLLPGVEALQADRYSRTVLAGAHAGWISVRPVAGDGSLELSISDSLAEHSGFLCAKVARMFDLNSDPSVWEAQFAHDPYLGRLVAAAPGLRLPSAYDPFELAVRAIVGQQVSVKAAITITRRLVARFGQPLQEANLTGAVGLSSLFPTAATLAHGNMDAIGMPTKRVATLQRLSAAVADGSLDFRKVGQTADELIQHLCELPGIGNWTAEYIALRGFASPDAFPAADLGLLKAPVWGPDGISAARLRQRAEAWRPWRAYAAMHLWKDYERSRSGTGPDV
jgi:DNA-3-methyladenine glycosylase II